MENLTEQDIIQIEAFLAQSLPSDQQQQLAQDEEFQERLSVYQLAREAIEAAGEAHLKAQLTELYQPEARVRSLRPVYVALAIAAAVVLLLIVFLPRSQPTPQELFAANYEKPLLGSGQRAAAQQTWINALSAYQADEFERARVGFRDILSDTSFQETDLAQIYLGVSYIELGKTDSAHITLTEVPQGSDYYYDAQWYIALSHIRDGNPSEAESILMELVTSSRAYQTQAEALLSSMTKD